MKAFFILWLIFFLGFSGGKAQEKKVKMIKDESVSQVFKQAKRERKHVLLDFGSPRCSPCLYIKNKIFTIDSIADFINSHFVVADYTQGEEKERLSAIYHVYTEPVLLILDTQGNLMHRMEGKCTPSEMMERLRQGLDTQNNLAAQEEKYIRGNRSSDFLIAYLETLHVAGLTEQKLRVLTDIFSPSFELEQLKEPKFWDIFVRYNESPVSREGCYVFGHREEFYDLFGKDAVEAKINNMFNVKLRTYTYGHTPPMKSEEYRKILSLLQHTAYPESSAWLAYLMPVQYKFKDWQAMAKAIQAAIDFNILKGEAKQTYMLVMSRQICWYADDSSALQYALCWIEEVIACAKPEALSGLEEEKMQILQKINDLKKGG